jgi:hypothetical protein
MEDHNHEEGSQNGAWIQENLRIIVSVFIVAAIALGIYSYSQRSEIATEDDDIAQLLDSDGNEISDSGKDSQLLDTKGEENDKADSNDTKMVEEGGPSDNKMTDDKTVGTKDEGESTGSKNTTNTDVNTKELSQETETAFIETATQGDGTTHLARRALAHHLEKNPDSTLTAEHKIYIEDYLRKNATDKVWLNPDESVEFSKDVIRQAIESSKNLNEHQLQNLQQFSHSVSAYQ